MWVVELIHLVRVWGCYKKSQGIEMSGKSAFLRQFETFRGVKDKG